MDRFIAGHTKEGSFCCKNFLSPVGAAEKLVFLKSSTIHRNLSEHNASQVYSPQSQFASNSVKLVATKKFYNKTSPVLYVHSTIHRSTIHRGSIHRRVSSSQFDSSLVDESIDPR
jgi:hypothetical protein